MKVDIYIKEKSGSREIRVPWLPEEIAYKSGDAVFASYDIMNRGEVAVPTGSGLATVSWESTFPGANRTDKSMLRGSWKSPETYHKILEDWMEKGTSLNVLVTGFPINLDVVLKEYKATPTGGFGDLDYELVLIEEREITITSTKEAKAADTPKRTTTSSATYTVKSGDSLWKIAAMKQHYGKGSQWTKIYNANKEIIESTAKKYRKGKGSDNGHWIYPGCVLRIVK